MLQNTRRTEAEALAEFLHDYDSPPTTLTIKEMTVKQKKKKNSKIHYASTRLLNDQRETIRVKIKLKNTRAKKEKQYKTRQYTV